jgi:hypothetical protein
MRFLKKTMAAAAAAAFCLSSLCASYVQDDIIVYFRTKPLKASMPKLVRFASEIVDDEHFDEQIAAINSMFGYPDYEGLSTKEALTVFVFEGQNSPLAPLFVAKLSKNSPMREKLTQN